MIERMECVRCMIRLIRHNNKQTKQEKKGFHSRRDPIRIRIFSSKSRNFLRHEVSSVSVCLPWHDGTDKLLGLKNDKTSSMRLPSQDVGMSIAFNLRQQTVQDDRKGCRDAALAASNRCLGWIVRFVGVIMVIVYDKMTFMFVNRLTRTKMTRRLEGVVVVHGVGFLGPCCCRHGGKLCVYFAGAHSLVRNNKKSINSMDNTEDAGTNRWSLACSGKIFPKKLFGLLRARPTRFSPRIL